MRKALTYGVLIYTLLIGFLYFFQEKLLYRPTNNLEHQSAININGVISDKINNQSNKAVIYFGGNSQSVSEMVFFLKKLNHHDVYLLNYPGFNGSAGYPNEESLNRSAMELYQKVSKQYDHIDLIGYSMGASVAVHLATQVKVNKLVLITPFANLSDLINEKIPVIPTEMILRNKHNNLDKAKDIHVETLVFLAGKDRLVPAHHGKKLADSINRSKTIFDESSDHNNILNFKTFDEINTFLN